MFSINLIQPRKVAGETERNKKEKRERENKLRKSQLTNRYS